MTAMTYAEAFNTFEKLVDYNSVPELTHKVIEQMKCDKEEAAYNLSLIAAFGAEAGFNGFVFYNQTVRLGVEIRELIKKPAQQIAEDMGFDSMLQMLSKYHCLARLKFKTDLVAEYFYNPQNKDAEHYDEFWDSIAKYAAEEVARCFNNFIQDEDIELIEPSSSIH